MSGVSSLYHTLVREVARTGPTVRRSTQRRLALLVTAIVVTQSCVIARLARRIHTLGLSSATPESIARRLRRTMNDPRLTATTCLASLLRTVVTQAIPTGTTDPLLVVIDESSHTKHVHLLRAALVYRGSTIPLAWATWAQNTAQPAGAYWAAMDQVFAEVADRLPAGRAVVVVADRLYASPAFIDRVTVHGWHWLVRVTTSGSHRWCPRTGSADAPVWGPQTTLKCLVQAALPGPGSRVRASGRFAKKAGWRAANLLGVWARGHHEPLVVLTDLPPRWLVLARYARRFWIEPGFRGDKAAGWHWEQSQVRDPDHHQVLLLALAWATLLSLWAGAQEGTRLLAAQRHRRARPTHARLSLAALGREALLAWSYGTWRARPRGRIPWDLPYLFGPAFTAEWSATLARRCIFTGPVRP